MRLPSTVLCTALVAVAATGCGSSDKSSSSDTGASAAPPSSTPAASGGASSNLSLAADSSGALKFDKKSLSAKAGNVTITMDNPSPVPHAIAVDGSGVNEDGKTVSMNGKSTVTVNLKPGTYKFFCPVDGHRAAGMEGTLTVK